MSKRQGKQTLQSASRHWISIGVFACLFAALFFKIISFNSEELAFLREQSEKRSIRQHTTIHSRGDILDREQRPIAMSSRVFTAYIDPRYYTNTVDNATIFSSLVGTRSQDIVARVEKHSKKRYVIIGRNVTPQSAEKIRTAKISGIYLAEHFKRFYPASEITAHLVGYTNNEGKGIEGLELSFDDWLQPDDSVNEVVVDGRGRVIRDLHTIKRGFVGKDVTLSIDLRIQQLAYTSLRNQVRTARAQRGTMLVMNPHSGEVLALASYPSYNPNNRMGLNFENVRNRVFTESFEPGSIIKPLTIAAALQTGRFQASSQVDTGKKRFFEIGNHRIADTKSHGVMTLEQVIAKSSNIGAAKIGLELGSRVLIDQFKKLAFDSTTGSYFPGEVEGFVPYGRVNQAKLATLSYGYGLKVTLAQIARAYSVLANGGYLVPVSLVRRNEPSFKEQVMDPKVVSSMIDMMTLVTRKGGTGTNAAIDGYEVAGKTGTVHKYIDHKYSRNKYRSLFVGFAPASDPQLVAVVMIDEPSENKYYGGEVAAPVFSQVIGPSLRLLHVSPDV